MIQHEFKVGDVVEMPTSAVVGMTSVFGAVSRIHPRGVWFVFSGYELFCRAENARLIASREEIEALHNAWEAEQEAMHEQYARF